MKSYRGTRVTQEERNSISIVVSAFNEEGNIAALWRELGQVLEKLESIGEYEVIFVDDGSQDGTLAELIRVQQTTDRVNIVQLRRNYGHEIAMAAGLDYATGDCAILMDADLQHPPSLIPQLVEKWQQGHDIVLTKRIEDRKDSLVKRKMIGFLYALLNRLQEEPIPPNAPDFRLIDRSFIDLLKQMDERDRLLRGLLSWATKGDFEFVDFTPSERFSGTSKYGIGTILKIGLDGVIAFTVKPLRASLYLGLATMVGALGLGAFSVWNHVYYNEPQTGFTTLLVAQMLLGSVQLLVLGVMGEYLGRIHIEVKKRPLYMAKFISGRRTVSNKE